MSKLSDAVNKKNRHWKELEKTILELVKEMHRLAGLPAYEPTTPELDKAVKGQG